MLVTLLSTEHLCPITRRFRKRFREHCLGYQLGLSPRRGSRKPELYPCLLLEAPVAVSTQLWSDKFPKCSNLGYHARIPWSKGVLARPCCTPISTAPLWCFGGYFSGFQPPYWHLQGRWKSQSKVQSNFEARDLIQLSLFHCGDKQKFQDKTSDYSQGKPQTCLSITYWRKLLQVPFKYSNVRDPWL